MRRGLLFALALLALPSTAGAAVPEVVSGQATAPEVQASRMILPQFSLQVESTDPARIGGTGAVQATLLRRGPGGLAVSKARVRLVGPAGIRMTGGSGPGWTCAAAGRVLVCSHPGAIASGRNPAPVTAAFAVASTARRLARAASATFAGDATWAGDPADATIGGPWLEADTADVPVRDALGVTLRSGAGSGVSVTTGLGEAARTFELSAEVRGNDGGQVRAEWFQVSGPAARLAAGNVIEDAPDHLTQTVVVPDSATGEQTYVFGVRVSSDGDVVERRVAVRVNASAVLPQQAFDQAQIGKLVAAAKTDFGDRTLTSAYVDDFDIAGPRTAVQPGRAVRLRIVNARVPLVQTGWIVNDTLVTKPKTNPQSFTVRAPALGAATSVEVIAVDRDGKVYSEGIVITGGQPVGRSGRALRHGGQATAEQQKAMCDTVNYYVRAVDEHKVIQDTLPGYIELEVPAAKVTITDANGKNLLKDVGDCKTATIAFEEAKLVMEQLKNGDRAEMVKKATMTDVKGRYTAAEGLHLTDAVWSPDIPYTKVVPLAGRWAGNVYAPFTGPAADRMPGTDTSQNPGELGALTGQFHSVADFTGGYRKYFALISSQVKLPGGYQIRDDSARLSFLNEATDKLPDGTLRLSEDFTDAPPSIDPRENAAGTISIHIDRSDGRYTTFGLTVANVVLGETAGGDTIEVTGTGTKPFADPNALVGDDDPSASIKLRVGCYRVEGVGYYAIREVVATCELFDGLAIKEFQLDWSAKGTMLMGQVEIAPKSATPYRLGVKGEYKSKLDWKVSVSTGATAPWSLDRGLQLTDFSGSIGRTPVAEGSDESTLTASIRAAIDGISFANGVSGSLAGEVTNECPKEAPAGTCTTGDIKLRITGTVTAQLTKTGNRDTFLVDGKYDFGRQRFRVQASYTGTALRVDGLGLKDAHLIVTNEKERCVKKGAEPDDTGKIKVEAAANLDVLNQPVGVTLMLGPSGVCLTGQQGAVDLNGGLKTKDGVVAFSDYTGGADIFVGGKRTPLTKERALTLQGAFEFPSDISTRFGTDPAKLTYMASLSTAGAEFEIASVPTGGSATIYSSRDGKTTLKLTRTVFNVTANWSPALQASLRLAAEGALDTAAGADGTPASSTPLGVAAGFAFSAVDSSGNKRPTFKVELGLGANIEQGKSVENAFGQKGMTLRGLYVAAAFNLPAMAPSLSVYADATLPSYLVGSVGLVNDPRVRFAANLALDTPCFDIQIGEEKQQRTALDFANAGIVTARYLRLYIAPWGCQIAANAKGEKVTIPAGWGFSFDGSLIGGEISVAFGAQLTPQVFKVKTDLLLPRIDLGVASLTSADGKRGAVFKIDVDTSLKRYNFDVDAALEVGKVDWGIGAKIAVKGSLKTDDPNNPGKVTFDIDGSGALRLTPLVRGDIRTLKVKGSITKAGGDNSKDWAKGTIGLSVYVLGQSLKIDGDVDYRNAQIALIQVSTKARLNILIAALDGELNFDYCLGTLSAYSNDGKKPTCTLYTGTVGASPTIRVGIRGKYRILWWTKNYVWVPYTQPGKEGSAPPIVKDTTPLLIPGDVPTGLTDDSVTRRYLGAGTGNFDVKLANMPGTNGTPYYLKAITSAGVGQVGNAVGCDKAALGATWKPTDANPNPAPDAVDPFESNRYGYGCLLRIARVEVDGPLDAKLGADTKILCRATVCVDMDNNRIEGTDPVTGQKVSGEEIRKALIAGLRVPPGLINAQQMITPDFSLLAGDGTTILRAQPFKDGSTGALEFVVGGKVVWSVDVRKSTIQGLARLKVFFSPQGTFRFEWDPGGGYRGPASVRDVGISIPTPASEAQFPAAIVRNGTLAVYASSDLSEGNLLWGVRKDGTCFAGKLVTNTTIALNFCQAQSGKPYPARQ